MLHLIVGGQVPAPVGQAAHHRSAKVDRSSASHDARDVVADPILSVSFLQFA